MVITIDDDTRPLGEVPALPDDVIDELRIRTYLGRFWFCDPTEQVWGD